MRLQHDLFEALQRVAAPERRSALLKLLSEKGVDEAAAVDWLHSQDVTAILGKEPTLKAIFFDTPGGAADTSRQLACRACQPKMDGAKTLLSWCFTCDVEPWSRQSKKSRSKWIRSELAKEIRTCASRVDGLPLAKDVAVCVQISAVTR